mmetsp:Transcript_57148/g.139321  ORF Transcript_57148/g.139321 Transcript_57148/m.139321 type:complete len:460 (-) Transcript_57148:122-1501(-)
MVSLNRLCTMVGVCCMAAASSAADTGIVSDTATQQAPPTSITTDSSSSSYQRKTPGMTQSNTESEQQQQQQQDIIMHGVQRDLEPSLAEKWALSDSGFVYANLSFTLDYITSDFILDTMATAIIYTDACQEGNTLVPSTVLQGSLNPDTTPVGIGETNRTFSVNVGMDTNEITGSNVYTENTVGNVTAQVKFCLRFGLWTNSNPAIEVNFLETIVTLDIDLTDGFEVVDVGVAARDELVRTAVQAYEVDGFLCDSNDVALTGQDLVEARNQGSILKVCVTPNADAQADGVFMRYIDSFSWTRDYGGVIGVVTQAAVVNRDAASNGLTDLTCVAGSLVCSFETILFASMYRTPGQVLGTGIASMQLGSQPISRRRRNLQLRGSEEDEEELRRLQQQDDDLNIAAVAEFDLSLEAFPVYNPYLERYRDQMSSAPPSPSSSSIHVAIITTAVTICTLFTMNW